MKCSDLLLLWARALLAGLLVSSLRFAGLSTLSEGSTGEKRL